eukprot:CAMPEP_0184859062 /NCGR_PEP_ID=MMETSP0580-20130426/4096_1 /TAXON_ID=1118495 /ORGANISM="Dactyliosolen fragilissimus" /LENGTH=75 /DNA_ID=CAMNT_0027355501 /DNA_START=373 /DNA_END=600 /DNA_ORIENTATION=-
MSATEEELARNVRRSFLPFSPRYSAFSDVPEDKLHRDEIADVAITENASIFDILIKKRTAMVHGAIEFPTLDIML